MANAPIEQPIDIPTDAGDVRAAALVVKSLQDEIKALGPAATGASLQASASMRALTAAASAAKKDLAAAQAVQAVRGARRNAPASSAAEGKARERAEQAAASAARKAIDDVAKADAKRIKEHEKAEKAAADAIKKEQKKNEEGRAAVAKAGDELIGKAAQVAMGAIVALTAAVAALSAKFLGALVSVQAFKESTVNAYAKILGGVNAADDAVKETIKTADQVGIGYKEALASVNALLAQGFKVDKAQELVKAMADLRSVNPAANIEAIVRAIGKIQATGHLQGDELNELNEAGLSAKLVYEALAKQLGKTVDEVQKMQKAGKLGSEDVIKAILSGVQATTKLPIGQAAAQAANSLQGLMERVSQLPEALLLSADASKGMGVVKDVLKNVLAAFGPGTEGGQAFSAALGKLGNAFTKLLSGLTGTQGKDALTSFAKGASKALGIVADIVERIGLVIGPSIGAFIKGLGKGLLAGDNMASGMKGDTATAEKLGKALAKVAEVIGELLGMFLALDASQKNAGMSAPSFGDKIMETVAKISSFITTIDQFATQVYTAATNIGNNLIAGIVAGINLAMPGLLSVVAAVANATTGTAKTGFGTHSPSVIWREEIGYQLPAGAAQGVDKGAPMMQRAAMRLTRGATAAGAAGAGGLLAGVRAAAGLVIEQLNVYARTKDDAQAIADAVDERIRLMLVEVSSG